MHGPRMQSLLILIVAALFVADPIWADEEETPEALPVVQSIEWLGNDAISTRDLRDHILTQATRWTQFWVTHAFRESELRGDMDRIATFYRLHGYYETVAEYSLVFDEPRSKVAIEIRIDEGKPVRTQSVRVRFPDGAHPTTHPLVEREHWEEFVASFPLGQGEIFVLQHYRTTSEMILAYFAELGFPQARLDGGAEVDLAHHVVAVAWTLELGGRVQFGEIEISGLEAVDEYIVEREIRFEPGEWYSVGAMARTQRRLQNLGLFHWTNVEAEPSEAEERTPPTTTHDETTWPVKIRVAERSPRRVRIGGGWGTDTSFRGELSWHHRNFFGGARRANVTLRYSGLGASFRPSFVEPYFLGTRTQLLVTPALLYETQDSYNARRILTDVQLRRQLTGPWSVRVGYHFDRSDVSSVTEERDNDELPEGVTINTGPQIGLRRSTVENPLNARSGTSLDYATEFSITAFGSDEDFIRHTFDARWFFEMWSTVVATRLLLGTIQNLSNTESEDIPLFERLYSGGSSSMRGFSYRSLSPRDIDGDPIGGSSQIESSIEWRIPLIWNIGVVGFIDAATVRREPFTWTLSRLRYAAGPGLRYDTPAGPIRLDFAWRLNPEKSRGKFRINASLGHTF